MSISFDLHRISHLENTKIELLGSNLANYELEVLSIVRVDVVVTHKPDLGPSYLSS